MIVYNPAMPKTRGLKGPFKHFQFKLYGDDIIRWKQVVRLAKQRALDRDEKITEADINRAIVGMQDAPRWLVEEDERLYVTGRGPLPESLTGGIAPEKMRLLSKLSDLEALPPPEIKARDKTVNKKNLP